MSAEPVAGAGRPGTVEIAGVFSRDRSRASEQVTEDLKAQILDGRLTRGARLPSEKELAGHYGVSSPTVREAMGALSALHLIEIRHGSGTYVTAEADRLLTSAMVALARLENIDIPSVLEVSEALFGMAVRLAPTHAAEGALAKLRAVAEQLAHPSNAEDLPVLLSAFLKTLVALSGNPLLIGLSGFLIDTQISLVSDVLRRAPSAWHSIGDALVEERLDIVRALEEGDAERAQTAVAVYMKRGASLVRLNADGA